MEDIEVIADYLFDTYDYDDGEENSYDNEDEGDDYSEDYYYSYN